MRKAKYTGGAPTLGRSSVNAWQSDSVSRDEMDYRVLGPLEVLDGAGETAHARGAQAAGTARPPAGRRQPDRVRRAARRRPMGRGGPGVGREDGPHLRLAAAQGLPPGALQTRPPGYALELGPRRPTSCASGACRGRPRGAPAGDAEGAAARLREALALWRGPALAEFAEPFARVEARAPRGAPARLRRGPDRRRPGPWPPRGAGRRARGARRAPPAARAAPRPAHARAAIARAARQRRSRRTRNSGARSTSELGIEPSPG